MCPYIYLVRFDLPCSTGTLPAPLGKYVNLRATVGGESIVRSYSPISRPSAVGHVDFLIKVGCPRFLFWGRGIAFARVAPARVAPAPAPTLLPSCPPALLLLLLPVLVVEVVTPRRAPDPSLSSLAVHPVRLSPLCVF